MKFDVKNVYAVNNAEEVKAGMRGWVANELAPLVESVNTGRKDNIIKIESLFLNSPRPFKPIVGNKCFLFFYKYEESIIEYRPFKNVEEFLPFRDRWIVFNGVTMRINGYSEYGTFIGNGKVLGSWERGFKELKFDDGTPFGVVK